MSLVSFINLWITILNELITHYVITSWLYVNLLYPGPPDVDPEPYNAHLTLLTYPQLKTDLQNFKVFFNENILFLPFFNPNSCHHHNAAINCDKLDSQKTFCGSNS